MPAEEVPADAAYQVASDEIAVLERAAYGLCDALDAERVFAGLVDESGDLRFRAAAPAGTVLPRRTAATAFGALADALERGIVTRAVDAPGPFGGSHETLVIPWRNRDRVLGAGIVVLREGAVPAEDAVLSFLGVQTGSCLSLLGECDRLAGRVRGLHDAASLLRATIEASNDAIKLIDLDGRIVSWNRAAEALYGWSEAEIAGEKMPHVPEDMRLRAIADIRAIAATGRMIERESVAQRPDGTPLRVALTVIPFVDGDGHPAGVLSVASRVVDRSRVDSACEDFAGVVSRELKAPLTAVLGYAQLLARPEILDDKPRRTRTLAALDERGWRLTGLIDDLMLASSLSERDLELECELIDIAGLVADVVGRFEDDSTGRRFVVDFEPGTGLVMADRRRLERATASLLGNAVKYSPDGGEIYVTITRDSSAVSIDVVDGGIGVTPDDLPHVFDRFFRGDNDIDRETPGTGLGLYLTRMIAEAHGGSVSAKSEAGGGSEFRITLPLASSD